MNRYARYIALYIIGITVLATGMCIAYFYYPSTPEIETIEVRFAYGFGFHYGQHVIMDHFDLVEKYSGGRAVAIYQKISGGTTINEAIVAGSLDFASMGVAPAIKGVNQGIGTKIFASMGSKEHELWTWRDDIQSIADIKEGDIISVVKIGSIEHVGLTKAFADLGRSKDEVEAVCAFFSHPDSFQLMEQREIDADFTGVPYTVQYAKDPAYHKIADDTSIWGTPMPGSCFVAHVGFCEEHPEIASAVLYAWIDATNWIINNQEEAAQIIGEEYGYDPSEVWDMWQASLLTWNPTFGISALEDVADIMYDLDMLSRKLVLNELVFNQTLGLIGR